MSEEQIDHVSNHFIPRPVLIFDRESTNGHADSDMC